MAIALKPMLGFFNILILSCIFQTSSVQTCSNYTFTKNLIYSSCSDLPHLGASLHWNYTSSTDTADITFKAPQTSDGWIAWGLNPKSTSMVGTQAIVAFRHSNGTMIAYPNSIDSYSPSMSLGTSSFPVTGVSAELVKNEMIIFATVGQLGKNSKWNHVWQEGSSVLNDVPLAHSRAGDNIKSMGSIDFQ